MDSLDSTNGNPGSEAQVRDRRMADAEKDRVSDSGYTPKAKRVEIESSHDPRAYRLPAPLTRSNSRKLLE